MERGLKLKRGVEAADAPHVCGSLLLFRFTRFWEEIHVIVRNIVLVFLRISVQPIS